LEFFFLFSHSSLSSSHAFFSSFFSHKINVRFVFLEL
jgi:hypothetical protein